MIKADIKNKKYIRKVLDELDQVQAKQQNHQVQLAMAIRQMVEMEMANLLGSKVSHFKFDLKNNGANFSISVGFVDDIGRYIYYGTQPHNISAGGRAMPVSNDKFATMVSHPGQPGMKREIDEAIQRGIMAGKAAAGGVGGIL